MATTNGIKLYDGVKVNIELDRYEELIQLEAKTQSVIGLLKEKLDTDAYFGKEEIFEIFAVLGVFYIPEAKNESEE